MRKRLRAFWSGDEGSASALVAVSLTALVALMALGIDVGMLFNAKSEAQRAVDSAALAGASAFLDLPEKEVEKVARERALDYATQNSIRKEGIDPSEVTISVNLDSATVTVWVRRTGVPTWFARILSVAEVPIGAVATAQAVNAGAAQCLKPFAVPDMWEETTDDTNGNRVWDETESWSFDHGRDRYEGYSGPGGSSTETGYGSDWRNSFTNNEGERFDRDYGRRIMIKATDPKDAFIPSFFYPWVLPVDGDQPDCGEDRDDGTGNKGNGNGNNGNSGNTGNGNTGNGNTGNGNSGNTGGGTGNGNGQSGSGNNGNSGNTGNGQTGGGNGNPGNGNGNANNGNKGGKDNGKGRGGAAYRRNICSCNASIIDLETEYLVEPGNMVGPTFQGVSTLIDEDPDAHWDGERVVSPYGEDSPRIITVALFDPTTVQKSGRRHIRFNNFARFFIERQDSPQDPVVGRFLFYVAGAGSEASGARTGSLVKRLRLIK